MGLRRTVQLAAGALGGLAASLAAHRLVDVTETLHWPLVAAALSLCAVAAISLLLVPPATDLLAVRRAALVFLTMIHFRNALDRPILEGILDRDLSGYTAVVTDNGQTVSLSLSLQLAALNCEVWLTCASSSRCIELRTALWDVAPSSAHLVHTHPMDVADLHSIRSFARLILRLHSSLDFIFNIAESTQSLTAQGVEGMLGVNYLGHFALTKWLLDAMLEPVRGSPRRQHDAAVVVNLAHRSFVTGQFHPSLFDGAGEGDWRGEHTNCSSAATSALHGCGSAACPAAARAALAGVMHAHELQHRVDNFLHRSRRPLRRLVALSVDSGAQYASRHAGLGCRLAGMLWGRSADVAARVLLNAVLDRRFLPGAMVDSAKNQHDLFLYSDRYLSVHRSLFREAADSYYHPTRDHDRLDRLWAEARPLSRAHAVAANASQVAVLDLLSHRLYDVTESLVEGWEKRGELFALPFVDRGSIGSTVRYTDHAKDSVHALDLRLASNHDDVNTRNMCCGTVYMRSWAVILIAAPNRFSTLDGECYKKALSVLQEG